MVTKQKLDDEKRAELLQQIETFKTTFWRLNRRNTYISNILIVVGLILAFGVTISGFLDYGLISGFMGAAITTIIGLQSAYNFSEKADFYHIIHNEAKALRDRLRFKVSTMKEFGDIVDELGRLRNYAAIKLPRGKGMETVKEMYSPDKIQTGS